MSKGKRVMMNSCWCEDQAVQNSPLAEMGMMKDLLAEALDSYGCSSSRAAEVGSTGHRCAPFGPCTISINNAFKRPDLS